MIGRRNAGAATSTTLRGLERSVSASTATCTLLGPEGSAPGLLGSLPRTSVNPRGVGDRECRPYVENYTVDASIFDSTRQ
jgi:hypothetical protein